MNIIKISNLIFKKINFLNTVRINFQHFVFNSILLNIACNSYLNLKNVVQLMNIFKLKECLCIMNEHQISIIIKIKDF